MADETLSRSTLQPFGAPTAPTVQRTVALTILAHPDPERVGQRAWLTSPAPPAGFCLSRAEPRFEGGGALRDPFLSRAPIRLHPAGALGVTISTEETRTQLSIDGMPALGSVTISHARLLTGVVLDLAGRVALLLHLRAQQPDHPALGLIGVSEGIDAVRADILRVADLDVPVLLEGETGTGKELVARALHKHGRRRAGPWVAVNMAVLSPQLAASSLFGHRRGAFSGATDDHDGYFVQAHGGTLLLDEIGELPAAVQPMLLRALETGEVTPVGGRTARRVDVRLIAATDTDLQSATADGTFRAPLLHRLAGFQMSIPPLRARREDIARLFFHFVRAELQSLGRETLLSASDRPWVPSTLVVELVRCPWPGNVRQLRNVARQLVIRARDAAEMAWTQILPSLLSEGTNPASAAASSAPDARTDQLTATSPRTPTRRARFRAADDVTEAELLRVLRTHAFRLQPAAAALGLSRTALYTRIEKSPNVRTAADLDASDIKAAIADHGPDLGMVAAHLEVSRHALLMRMTHLGLRG